MLMDKQKASLATKVIALIVALAFVLSMVVWTIPFIRQEKTSSSGKGAPDEIEAQRYYEEAVYRLEQVLSKDPENLPVIIELGNLHFDYRNYPQAIDAYQKALELDPENGDVRVDMGIAYFYSGDPDRAIGELSKVIEANPQHAMAYLNLGVVYAETGRKEEAIKAWERYLELEPEGSYVDFVKEELAKLRKMGE